jgi:hypothetical protein
MWSGLLGLLVCFCVLAFLLPASQKISSPTVVRVSTPVVGIAHTPKEYVRLFELQYHFRAWKTKNNVVQAVSEDDVEEFRMSVKADDVWRLSFMFPAVDDEQGRLKSINQALKLLQYAVPDGDCKNWLETALSRPEYIVYHRDLKIYFSTDYFGQLGLIMTIEEM